MFFEFSSIFLVIAGAFLLGKWFIAQMKYIKSEIAESEPLLGILT